MQHAAAALLLSRMHGYVQATVKIAVDGQSAWKTTESASKLIGKIDAWSANSEAQASGGEGIVDINSLLYYSYYKILILVREGYLMDSL